MRMFSKGMVEYKLHRPDNQAAGRRMDKCKALVPRAFDDKLPWILDTGASRNAAGREFIKHYEENIYRTTEPIKLLTGNKEAALDECIDFHSSSLQGNSTVHVMSDENCPAALALGRLCI